jgi:hypothetical protein
MLGRMQQKTKKNQRNPDETSIFDSGLAGLFRSSRVEECSPFVAFGGA